MRGQAGGVDPTKVVIDYTNYRGERARRCIVPLGIEWGRTAQHPEPQWLLFAVDVVKGMRTFAMRDIHSWEPVATIKGEVLP